MTKKKKKKKKKKINNIINNIDLEKKKKKKKKKALSRVYILSSKRGPFFFGHISSEKLSDMQAIVRNCYCLHVLEFL